VRRREFITLIGSAATWPLAARAQQATKLPAIGFLVSGAPSSHGQWVAAFVQRLRELQWIESRTVAIEYRWAEGSTAGLDEMAAEFVRLKVDVIVTTGTPATAAAKRTTLIIPVMFVGAGDPVGTGLVATLARPAGNVTGLSSQQADTTGKRLELLREVVPNLHRLAILANIENAVALSDMRDVETAAAALGLSIVSLKIRRSEDIASVFEALKDRGDALYVATDPLLLTNRIRINTLALGVRVPAMYGSREYVEVGGLMSYGANYPVLFRRAADFVDKILRGAKPADIPVEQPTKFDLVINLTTAKALGLTIPSGVLARADEVIE
jgi:putative ABC transport system substrate-binding protein